MVFSYGNPRASRRFSADRKTQSPVAHQSWAKTSTFSVSLLCLNFSASTLSLGVGCSLFACGEHEKRISRRPDSSGVIVGWMVRRDLKRDFISCWPRNSSGERPGPPDLNLCEWQRFNLRRASRRRTHHTTTQNKIVKDFFD
jgi:hypothetical protein